MNKIKFFTCLLTLSISSICWADNMFWTFDDNQTPIIIPPECDARFDEVHGGVFMPTTDELYSYGKEFLSSDSLNIKQQGTYCLLGAAWQGNANAQYILAKIYQEGKILPQDHLSAYKWAFVSALSGNKEAERLTLLLEQYLTTKELEQTTQPIKDTKNKIDEYLKKQQDAQMAKENSKENTPNKEATNKEAAGVEGLKNILPDTKNIFSEKDRMK